MEMFRIVTNTSHIPKIDHTRTFLTRFIDNCVWRKTCWSARHALRAYYTHNIILGRIYWDFKSRRIARPVNYVTVVFQRYIPISCVRVHICAACMCCVHVCVYNASRAMWLIDLSIHSILRVDHSEWCARDPRLHLIPHRTWRLIDLFFVHGVRDTYIDVIHTSPNTHTHTWNYLFRWFVATPKPALYSYERVARRDRAARLTSLSSQTYIARISFRCRCVWLVFFVIVVCIVPRGTTNLAMPNAPVQRSRRWSECDPKLTLHCALAISSVWLKVWFFSAQTKFKCDGHGSFKIDYFGRAFYRHHIQYAKPRGVYS